MLTKPSRLDLMRRLGRAMADPTRSRILLRLLDGPGYPARLAEELGLTRSNVSNHLACLRGCGIVVAEPEGRRTRYEIADARLAAAMSALLEATVLADTAEPCLPVGPAAERADTTPGQAKPAPDAAPNHAAKARPEPQAAPV